MVVLGDIKEHFFNSIVHKRILVLVNTDVDAVCAWKILQILLKHRHVRYTAVPIEDKEQLHSAYHENNEDISAVVFVNCGANFDVIELMDVGESNEVTFYICDNHRPININNFYNQTQIKILTHEEEFESVPAFDAVFRDDESDGDDDDDDDGVSKRRRFDESVIERRIERRNWNTKRQELLLEYEECSFRSTSSALIFFDLAWKLSQDSTELLWFAIVGHTSLLVTHAVNREHYMDSVDYLQNQVARLSRSGSRQISASGDAAAGRPLASLKISFEEEVLLNLHRHWSLREAMENSQITATKFKLFMVKGQKKLQEFLAHVGVPQRQCEQKFSSMDVKLRTSLPNLFADHGEKFGLERRDIFLPSFVTYNGYRTRLSAIDAAHMCVAVLENSVGGSSVTSNFRDACEVISDPDYVDEAILQAQRLLRVLTRQVQQFLDTDDINVFRAFLYIHVSANSLLNTCLRRPLSMSMLARLALNAKAAIRPNLGRNKRTQKLPLLLCIDSPDVESNVVTVMGVPPLQGDDDRNVFGQAFESAAQTTKSKVSFLFFDTFVMEVKRDDLLKLFEALASLLS